MCGLEAVFVEAVASAYTDRPSTGALGTLLSVGIAQPRTTAQAPLADVFGYRKIARSFARFFVVPTFMIRFVVGVCCLYVVQPRCEIPATDVGAHPVMGGLRGRIGV